MENKKSWIKKSITISIPIPLLITLPIIIVFGVVLIAKATATPSTFTDSFTTTDNIASTVGVTVNTSNGTISLEEASTWSCGDTFTDARDGNTYNTVLIGTQCWMQENLNYGTLTLGANEQGTTCPSEADTEKYCYDDSEANCDTYGGLYQWNQMMCGASSCNGTGEEQPACSSPVQGICPSGWHIPSHYEWTQLARDVCTSGTCATDFSYDTNTSNWRGTDEGTKLTTGGSSNFEGLLAGVWENDLNGLGSHTHFWASLQSESGVWDWSLYAGYTGVRLYTVPKTYGYSVRCIKD